MARVTYGVSALIKLSFLVNVVRVDARPQASQKIVFGGSDDGFQLLRVGGRCEKGKVLWLEDGQCYSLGDRGPCDFGHILVFDKKPLCRVHTAACNTEFNECSTEESDKYEEAEGTGRCKGDKVKWTDGQCYQLASTGPCGPGRWLVLDSVSPTTGQPAVVCRDRRCEDGQVWWIQDCACLSAKSLGSLGKSNGPCSSVGEEILVSPYGTGVCGCKEGYVRHSDGNCYKPGLQGPCGDEEVLNVEGDNTVCEEVTGLSRRIYDLIPPNEEPGLRLASRKNCKLDRQGRCRVVINLRSRRDIEDEDGDVENLIEWLGSFESDKTANCRGKPCGLESLRWEDGKCYSLATQGPCGEGRLLVLENIQDGKAEVNCKVNRCPEGVWWAQTCSCLSVTKAKSSTFHQVTQCGPQENVLIGPYGAGVCACNLGFRRGEDGVCRNVNNPNTDLKVKIFDLVPENLPPQNTRSIGRATQKNCKIDRLGRCRETLDLRNRIDGEKNYIDAYEVGKDNDEDIIKWLDSFKPSEENCNLETKQDDCHRQGKVLFEDGECYNLLERGPCYAEEMWLVMSEEADGTLVPQCQPRACFSDGVFNPQDCHCYSKSAPDVCSGPDEQLLLDVFGRGVCGCKAGHVVWGEDQVCHKLYQDGSCGEGKVLIVDEEGIAVCRAYNCSEPGMLEMEGGHCFMPGEQGTCGEGLVAGVDSDTLLTSCVSQVDLYVFDLIPGHQPGGNQVHGSGLVKVDKDTCVLDRRGRCRRRVKLKRHGGVADQAVDFREWIESFKYIAPSKSNC